MLVFVVFAFTGRRNTSAPAPTFIPFFIGFTVACLISLFAPITQAGWNPARDFGPRLFTAVAGWGGGVFTAANGWWWVPVVAPVIGAVLGAWLYDLFINNHHAAPEANR